MKQSEIQEALQAAVEEVLETMCFMGVLDSGAGKIPADRLDGSPALTAELRFDGSPSGGFRVRVPQKVARLVGAAFLGRDESELADSQAQEVLCEMANMICGAALSRLEKNVIFRIGQPVAVPPERETGFDGAADNRWFDLEDGVLAVSLELLHAA